MTSLLNENTQLNESIPPRSPSMQKRVIEHAMQKEDNESKNTWKSLCLVMDRRAVQYFTQIAIIVGVMCFCIYKLVTDPSCEAQKAYTGLLTLAMGVVVPSPKFE